MTEQKDLEPMLPRRRKIAIHAESIEEFIVQDDCMQRRIYPPSTSSSLSLNHARGDKPKQTYLNLPSQTPMKKEKTFNIMVLTDDLAFAHSQLLLMDQNENYSKHIECHSN